MKLSIITPSYNQGRFIGEALRSILNQDIDFPLEYIIVDAVSTDETKQVVESYSKKFREKGVEFKLICEKDNGQSDAINKGWKMATGDIITYLNSDDYYEPNKLKDVMEYFSKNPSIKWAYGGWNLVTKKSSVFLTLKPKKYNKRKLLNYCNIGQPSCFFRESILKEVGMLNEKLHFAMDYDLWLRFASKYDAGIINSVISNMRYHEDAKSSYQTEKQLKEILRVGGKYTKPLSFQRFAQYFFYARGMVATVFKISKIHRGISSSDPPAS